MARAESNCGAGISPATSRRGGRTTNQTPPASRGDRPVPSSIWGRPKNNFPIYFPSPRLSHTGERGRRRSYFSVVPLVQITDHVRSTRCTGAIHCIISNRPASGGKFATFALRAGDFLVSPISRPHRADEFRQDEKNRASARAVEPLRRTRLSGTAGIKGRGKGRPFRR
jgi:hypothetical protein